MGVLDGCQEARQAVTIGEIPCPGCGGSVEIFVKDGALAADAVCETCGHTIPAGTRMQRSASEDSGRL